MSAWTDQQITCPHCHRAFTLAQSGFMETVIARSPYGPRDAVTDCPHCKKRVFMRWQAEPTDRALKGRVTVRATDKGNP